MDDLDRMTDLDRKRLAATKAGELREILARIAFPESEGLEGICEWSLPLRAIEAMIEQEIKEIEDRLYWQRQARAPRRREEDELEEDDAPPF